MLRKTLLRNRVKSIASCNGRDIETHHAASAEENYSSRSDNYRFLILAVVTVYIGARPSLFTKSC